MEEAKTVEQTTEKTATETTVNEETTTPETTVEPSTETEKGEVDFKAELLEAEKTISKQEGIINHKEDVIIAEKEKNKATETVEQEDDKFAEFKKEQSEEMDKFKLSQTKDKIDGEINRLAKSEDEAKLIRFHLENSVKMGDYSLESVQVGVKRAWMMANEKNILNTNVEMAEALKSKASLNTTASSSSQPVKKTSDEFTGEEKKIIDLFDKKGKAITDSAPR